MVPNKSPQPELLATAEGEILAERNMFRLDDIGSLLALGPEDEPPAPGEDLVTSSFGAAVFSSALSYHYPRVALEHWSAPSPALKQSWERSAEVHLEIDGGTVGLSSGVSPGLRRSRRASVL